MANVEFHPLAIDEVRAARRWYARVSQNLAVAHIGANPAGYPPHLHGTRIYRLNRFPYLVVYLELTPDRVLVVAVAHAKRRPGYWRRRLP